MDKITAIFKALSDRNRIRIVSSLLNHNELCACQITELLQVTGATASRHMGVLISSGLVDSRKDGRWVYYRICREKAELGLLIDWIEAQMHHDPVVVRDAKTVEEILSWDPEELCRKQRGEACCPLKQVTVNQGEIHA